MQLSLSQTPKSISSANYLLRQYGGAAAAYSLQRLDTSTTNVVRARRSTDDAESNFTAEEVSGGSLREFALQNDADLIRFANQATAADKRMYFDGVNDYVLFSAFDFDSAVFRFTYLHVPGESQILQINDDANSGHLLAVTANNTGKDLIVRLADIATNTTQSSFESTSLTDYGVYDVVVTFGSGGNTISGVTINDVALGASVQSGRTQAAGVTANTFYLGRRQDGSFPYTGLIYDVSVDSLHAWNGYGNTNADWEDQVGSNDGTVNGSPALFSGQGFDAYVTTLYDQSGNGRNATQATAASQPQIVADGVVVTDANGLETITFDGVDDSLHTASFTVAQPDTIFTKFQSDTNPNEGSIFDGISGRQLFDSTGGAWRIFAGSSVTGGTRDANENLASILFNGASSQAWVNGSSVITGNPSTNSITGGIRLGTNNSAADPLSGSISELIIYPSDQSANRTAIEANIASRYGITLA